MIVAAGIDTVILCRNNVRAASGVQVFALGFVSVFDQVLDGMPEDTDHIFKAYIGALDEDAERYRADADKLGGWAKELKGASDLTPSESGNDVSHSSMWSYADDASA